MLLERYLRQLVTAIQLAHLCTKASKPLACSAATCCRTAASRLRSRKIVVHIMRLARWKVRLASLCSTAG